MDPTSEEKKALLRARLGPEGGARGRQTGRFD